MSRAKKELYTEQYYSLTEDEMQEIIARAQRGDGSAQLELLEIFSNFLSKYITMLYHGRFSTNDYDIRKFISLFVKDKTVRIHLSRNKLNAAGRAHVNEVMRGIHYMIRRYGDEEDVRQTVNMTFLRCVSHYTRRESKVGGYVPFSGYLYSYFYFLLQKNVVEFLIDQAGRKTFPLITDEDPIDEDGEFTPGFTIPPAPSAEEMIFSEVIDEDWVSGETAHFPFDQLTVQERQLLKWKYSNGEKSSQIAERTTEHPNTVRDHFNKIKAKLNIIMESA